VEEQRRTITGTDQIWEPAEKDVKEIHDELSSRFERLSSNAKSCSGTFDAAGP
jgi:hypothetical protein